MLFLILTGRNSFKSSLTSLVKEPQTRHKRLAKAELGLYNKRLEWQSSGF
jgi:hypothetical protein